jgi:UDP-glucuronate 4-epimerase
MRVNVGGTTSLLQAAADHGAPKFIFASSSSVYGNNRKVPFSEDDRVDHPISPYAASKKACELICHAYHHLYDMPMTCLRFFTVYGPRNRPDLAAFHFTDRISRGLPIRQFGDGTTRRDYTYIDDIVSGITAAIDRCEGYHLYNLGNNHPVTLTDMIATIADAVGKKPVIEVVGMQPGDVEVTYADIARAQRDLDYRPITLFAEGIHSLVAWYRQTYG